MALDSFQETTSRSWFARISDSIKGILFGLILFVDPEFGMAVTAIIGIKRVKGVRSASAAA